MRVSDQNINEPAVEPAVENPASGVTAKPVGKFASLRNDPKGWIVLILAIAPIIAFVGAAFGSGIGLWGWQQGLGFLGWTLVVAVLAIIIGIIGIILDKRKGRKTRWPKLGVAMIAAVGFVG